MSGKKQASKWLKKEESESSSDEEPKKVAPKTATKAPVKNNKKNTKSSSDDSDLSEDEKPKKSTSKQTTKPSTPTKAAPAAKKPTKKSAKDSSDESDDDKKKAPAKKGTWFKTKAVSDSESSSSEEEDKKKKDDKKKWFSKGKVSESESESNDDDDDDDSDDEPVVKKTVAPKPAAKQAPAKANKWLKKTKDSESDDDSEDDEESDRSGDDEPVVAKKTAAPKPAAKPLAAKANKWLKKEGSDESSSSSSDENDLSETDEESEGEPEKPVIKSRFGDSDSDESDDGVKRVVKSQKVKRKEELKEIMDKIDLLIKDSEWKSVTDEMTALFKSADKLMKVPEIKEIPKSYIRFISKLDDEIDRAQKEKKKMTPTNAKALGSIKGKIRKYNAQYKSEINLFKSDPDAYIDEDDVLDQVDSEEEESGDEADTSAQSTNANNNRSSDRKVETNKTSNKTSSAVETKKEEINWTDDVINAKIDSLRADVFRGVSPLEQIKQLKDMLSRVKSDAKQLQILIVTIAAQFNINPNQEFMPSEQWKSCYANTIRAINLIERNPQLHIYEADDVSEERYAEMKQSFQDKDVHVRIDGSIAIIFDRLDDEFTKSLQSTDPQTYDYVNRLRDESVIMDLGERVLNFYRIRQQQESKASSCALRILEHLHHRKQSDHEKLLANQRLQTQTRLTELTESFKKDAIKNETTVHGAVPASAHVPHEFTFDHPVINNDLSNVVNQMVNLVYKYGDLMSKTKALLFHVYNSSLAGDFYGARDVLLHSNLQSTINGYPVDIQVLFNRAVTQLGLCAFRNGLIAEAHDALMDICNSQRTTLLAQSNVRFQDKSKRVEVDRQEKQRRIPFHRHINMDMLEGVHLISAMLLEVPNMAQDTFNNVKKKNISKAFRRLLDFYDRQQVYAGPPENTRDYINVAARALLQGDWQKCNATLLEMNDMWSSMIDAERVKGMLLERIKVEALRTYLLQYSRHYDTMSAQRLSSMFDMDVRAVHSVVSRMMIGEELHAAWDQPTQTIRMYHAEPNKLQYLALQLAERATTFVEYNERLYDAKSQGGSLIAPSKEQKERSAAHRAQQQQQQSGEQQQQQSDKKAGAPRVGYANKTSKVGGQTGSSGQSGAPQKPRTGVPVSGNKRK